MEKLKSSRLRQIGVFGAVVGLGVAIFTVVDHPESTEIRTVGVECMGEATAVGVFKPAEVANNGKLSVTCTDGEKPKVKIIPGNGPADFSSITDTKFMVGTQSKDGSTELIQLDGSEDSVVDITANNGQIVSMWGGELPQSADKKNAETEQQIDSFSAKVWNAIVDAYKKAEHGGEGFKLETLEVIRNVDGVKGLNEYVVALNNIGGNNVAYMTFAYRNGMGPSKNGQHDISKLESLQIPIAGANSVIDIPVIGTLNPEKKGNPRVVSFVLDENGKAIMSDYLPYLGNGGPSQEEYQVWLMQATEMMLDINKIDIKKDR